MSKSLKQIADLVENFCVERGWKNSNPNQLIASIFIELGELAEHYQWRDKFEKYTPTKKREIGYEFVDVLFYLLRLANNSGIDIEHYFDIKLPQLRKKFPIGITDEQWDKVHNEYRKNGKNKLYE
jgi:NTP pyrophosphatase (non-canonical NTP hydrolase)